MLLLKSIADFMERSGDRENAREKISVGFVFDFGLKTKSFPWLLALSGTLFVFYMIFISFQPYIVHSILLAFAEAKHIAAGYIKVNEVNGLIHTTNFAISELICKILFDPDLDDKCHVLDITSAIKYLYEVSHNRNDLNYH